MGLFDGLKRRKRRHSVDRLSSLLSESLGRDPAEFGPARPEEAWEPTGQAWEGMVCILAGGDSPKALLLLGAGLPGNGAEVLAAGLAAASASGIAPILRRERAEDWRLELERRRMGDLRCRMDKARTVALLVEEGLARLVEARQEPAAEEPAGEESGTFALDHPALLALPALFCPREWQAGGSRAAVSWTGLAVDPPETRELLRWTAAWTSGEGAAKMGFYLELGVPHGAEPASVARAVEPLLAAAWRQAWPGLCAALPGISAPLFGRSATRPARAEVAVLGRFMAGAASLELSLLIPAALLRLLIPPLAPSAQGAQVAATGGREASIGRFLAANDALLEASMRSKAAQEPPRSDGAPFPEALPSLPSFLALFSEGDLARLVQGHFLPACGALGFQAFFFYREETRAPGTDGRGAEGAKGRGPTHQIQPFDERRILAALPAASREEWVEARRASLPLVDRDSVATLAAGAEALAGAWGAFRKGRLELSYGGQRLAKETLGDILEAADRNRLEELAAQDLPLALIGDLGRERARRVLDRLSVRDLAVATWGPPRKRPLLEANLSRGKREELAAEAAILGRRLGSGEEAAGAVADAREALVARVRGLLDDLAREEGRAGPRPGPEAGLVRRPREASPRGTGGSRDRPRG